MRGASTPIIPHPFLHQPRMRKHEPDRFTGEKTESQRAGDCPCPSGGTGPLFPPLGLHPDLHLWGPGCTSVDLNTWSRQAFFFCNCRWSWPFLWGRCVPKPVSKLDVNKQAQFPPELPSFPRDVAFLPGPRVARGRRISLPVTAPSVTSGSGGGQAENKHLRS